MIVTALGGRVGGGIWAASCLSNSHRVAWQKTAGRVRLPPNTDRDPSASGLLGRWSQHTLVRGQGNEVVWSGGKNRAGLSPLSS